MTKRKNLCRALSIALFIPILALTVPQQSHGADKKAEPTLFDDDLPIAVQMSSMLLPVSLPNGRQQKTAMTPFLIGYDIEGLSFLCRRAPKVREALFVAFGKRPVKSLGGSKIDTIGAGKVARSAINRSLGKKIVKRGYIMLGSKSVSQGVAARLPGSSVGCQRIASLPKDIALNEASEANWELRKQKREERQKWRDSIRKHRTLEPPKKTGE